MSKNGSSSRAKHARVALPAPKVPLLRRRGRPRAGAAHAVPEAKVLDAAFQGFARGGYDGTTLRSLAKQLGVSHNLINVRFGSKASLWRLAVDARVARAAPPVYAAFDAPGLNEESRLRQFIHRFCRWAVDNPELVGIINVECRHASWRLDYLVDVHISRFKLRLDQLMQQVAAIRPVRPLSTTGLMSMLMQGVGFYFASGPMLERLDAAEEIAASHRDAQVSVFAEFVLAGLLSVPEVAARKSK
jgi:TetR/AcrR family transcriptional regulator